MTTRGYCSKICEKEIYPIPSNNISKKMLQSKLIRLNGRGSVAYDNTLSYMYTHTILSANFDDNKSLLLSIRYKAYMRYFSSSIKCGDTGKKASEIYNMLQSIIASLTKEEYNHIFDIIEQVDVSENIVFKETEITFYVIVREMYNYDYFIIKNITNDYYLYPKRKYIFDLSDPSNLNRKFCLSEKKDGIKVNGLTYEGPPGEPGAKLSFDVPDNLTSGNLYVFNDNIRFDNGNLYIDEAYGRWGYNIEYINVKLTTFVQINSYINTAPYKFICINQYSNLAVYEYKGPKYYFNNNINIDILTDLDTNRYVVSYGTYYLYVPKIYTATILNNGYQDCISFIGDSSTKTTEYLTDLNLATNPVSGNYNFYYDKVIMTIYKPFNPMTFYSKRYGYLGSVGLLYFSDSCIDYGGSSNANYYIEYGDTATYYGIQTQTKINIITDNLNNYVTFNNNTNINIKYGMYIGEYYIFNIPQNKPITFLNRGKENIVTLNSVNGNYVLGLGPDGNTYKFYSGTLLVTIRGNFGFMSVYSIFSGYMGGYALIKYGSQFDNTSYYPDPLSVPQIDELPGNTTFNEIITSPIYYSLNYTSQDTNIPFSDLYTGLYSIVYNEVTLLNNNIIINNITPYNIQNKYTLKIGLYVLRSNGNYLAILNSGKTNSIKYYGSLSVDRISPDSNKYIYYKDFIVIYVFGNFGFVSLDISGKGTGIYMLVYDL
jgi:hypothetical protein